MITLDEFMRANMERAALAETEVEAAGWWRNLLRDRAPYRDPVLRKWHTLEEAWAIVKERRLRPAPVEAKPKRAATRRPKAAPKRKAAPRRGHEIIHDIIEDRDVFAAVQFARVMIRQGKRPDRAICFAAKHYKCSTAEVARYVGQVAGRVASRRRQ